MVEGSSFIPWVGWVGLVVWQETKWRNLLIPHKGQQGEDVWVVDCGCQKPVKITLHDTNLYIYIML